MGAVSLEAQIRERYEKVLGLMAEAARAVGRDPGEVRLVVVTKTHPVETVQAALAEVRCFGENYAEEAVEKMRRLEAVGVDVSKIAWHMIGHVQSRKAALIPTHFDLLHSLDSVKLAQRLNDFAGSRGGRLPVLLQLNVSGEESKFGMPAWQESQQQNLLAKISQIVTCSNLEIRGLMTMPPYFDQPELARPYFRKLREWREVLAQVLPQIHWDELSMGMSGDFEVAIQEGATLVRVGTAILGARTANQ